LRSLGKSLTERYGVDVQVRVADLANLDELENLAHAIEEIPGLELLVNNAGFGLSGGFIENDPRMTTDMVTVHVTAPMRLTRATLPGMLARGRGAVINVSSMSAFLPSPKAESYAATKAALNTFSLAMARELEGKGIRVQALCPGLTHTEFHANLTGFDRSAIPELLWLTADEVARRSLEALKDGPVIFIPSPIYRLAAALISQPLLAPLVGLGAKISAHRFARQYLGQE
jgi:short-subunit dehydrogenase